MRVVILSFSIIKVSEQKDQKQLRKAGSFGSTRHVLEKLFDVISRKLHEMDSSEVFS